MTDLCASDPDLDHFDLSFFSYRTSLFHIPLFSRFASIPELARGLSTELNTHCQDRPDVTLVGHSLGGIVIRQYLVSELKAGRVPIASRVVLYAAPNEGATLAEIGRHFSIKHRHLSQLSPNANLLRALNEDWKQLGVETAVPVTYVAGGSDWVVAPQSAGGGSTSYEMLAEHDHSTIVRPTDLQDTRYRLLKNRLPLRKTSSTASTPITLSTGSPLFDIYSLPDEPFYVPRKIDYDLHEAVGAHHIWLVGDSGVGKTAALRRLGLLNGRLRHVLLGGYQNPSPLDVVRAVAVELSDGQGGTTVARDATLDSLIREIKSAIRTLPGQGPLTLLIEEIPLPPGEAYTEFLSLIGPLCETLQAGDSDDRVTLAFSSIGDPTPNLPENSGKLRERIQFIHLSAWSDADIAQLIERLCSALKIGINETDKTLILSAARGSPRFVKMLFRHLNRNRAKLSSLDELVKIVRAEQL